MTFFSTEFESPPVFRTFKKIPLRSTDIIKLAAIMNVSPKQVNKWVKGKENFTLETLSRIEETLKITLLAMDTQEESI